MTLPSVCITGCGMVTALGPGVISTWKRLVQGCSGIRAYPRACLSTSQSVAGDVAEMWRTPHNGEDMAGFAMQAAREAMSDAEYSMPLSQKLRVGIVVGCSAFGVATLVQATERIRVAGAYSIPPPTLPMILSNNAAAVIGQWCGATGPTWTINTGCASGVDAIGIGRQMLQSNMVDLVIAGGTEAPLWPWGFAGLAALRVLAFWEGEPEDASRPCDTQRTGLVLSEGAAMCVLERIRNVRDRDAVPLAIVQGYASTTDERHGTQSSAPSIAACIRLALDDAREYPNTIDAYDLHATGTRIGDPLEAEALRIACGAMADRTPAVATKAALGHALAASGAIETVLAVQALRTQSLPPTRNWQTPDPACLHGLSSEVRELSLRHILKVSIGFGGHNACLVLGRGASI